MGSLYNFSKLIHKKKNLLRCIFTTLLLQLIVTTLTFVFIYKNKFIKRQHVGGLLSGLIFITFAIVLIYAMTSSNITFTERALLFTLFSIVQGLFLGFNLQYVRANTILGALLFTGILFIMMLLVGFLMVYFQIDLSWLGIILFFLLLGLIIARIMTFFGNDSRSYDYMITLFALLLFSVYIVYDTNTILMRYDSVKYERDCILGALDYYLDIINIFVSSLD